MMKKNSIESLIKLVRKSVKNNEKKNEGRLVVYEQLK